MDNTGNIQLNVKFSILACIVGGLNVITCQSFDASLILVIIESLVLCYWFLRNSIAKYLAFYIIFLCLSMEFGALFDSQIYGFKEFRVLGINLGVVFLFPIALKTVLLHEIRVNNNELKIKKAIRMFVILATTGIIMGLIVLLVDDNNISRMDGYLIEFVNQVYVYVIIPFLVILNFLYVLNCERKKLYYINYALYAVMLGVSFQLIVSKTFLIGGRYGGAETLVASSVVMLLPLMLNIIFYKKAELPYYYFPILLIGTCLALIYNTSGKLIIFTFIVPLTATISMIQKKRYKKLLMSSVVLGLAGFLLFNLISNNKLDGSIILESKFNQVMSLFNIGENWMAYVENSPQIRIAEIINIITEYVDKPWYLLIGKGLIGTTPNYTSVDFSVPGGFSAKQVNSGLFFAVHESFPHLFLINGLLGIYFYLQVLLITILNIKISPIVLLGGVWFLLFYGYSVTISVYGLFAFFISAHMIDNEK